MDELFAADRFCMHFCNEKWGMHFMDYIEQQYWLSVQRFYEFYGGDQ